MKIKNALTMDECQQPSDTHQARYNKWYSGDLKMHTDRNLMEHETNRPIKDIQIGDYTISTDYFEDEKERAKKQRKKFENGRKDIYKLLAKRQYIRNKLDKLDLNKKKDYKLAGELNYKLEFIEWDINRIREECQFDYAELYGESYSNNNKKAAIKEKLKSLKDRIVDKCKKAAKKTKKFIKKNADVIRNIVVGVIVGVITWFLDSKFGKTNTKKAYA